MNNLLPVGKHPELLNGANYQLFLTEICDLLGVEKPKPASANVKEASYTFERPVEFDDGEGKKTTNFIDLYKQIALSWKQNKVPIKLSLVKQKCLELTTAKQKQEPLFVIHVHGTGK